MRAFLEKEVTLRWHLARVSAAQNKYTYGDHNMNIAFA
jgi:hypothetical protein